MAALACRRLLALVLVGLCGAVHVRGPRPAPVAYVGANRSVVRWGFVEDPLIEAEDLVASIAPGGVWMAQPGGPQEKQAPVSLAKYKSKYGFYLHTHGEPEACIHLLREVRRVYPREPVYVMSDGGMNFSGLCREIGRCEFSWKPAANDRWNPMPFFLRFQEAARRLNSKFVVMLEPDNELRHAFRSNPQDDAGGLDDSNPGFHKVMVDYVERKGRESSGNRNFTMKWHRFGLAGGSYFSTSAILDAFDPDTIDWRQLLEYDGHRMFSSDVAMPLALAIHGYTFYPWEEVTQTRFGLRDKAALRHYGREEVKPHYHEALSSIDAGLVTKDVPPFKDVRCQGCVWIHSDDECLAQTPFQCPITRTMGPPASWQPVNKTHP